MSPSDSHVLFTRSVRRRNFIGFPFLVSSPPETCALIASQARTFSATAGFSTALVLVEQPLESIGLFREREWLPERPVSFPGKQNFKLLFVGNDESEHALFGEIEHWTQIKTRRGLPDAVDSADALTEKKALFSHSPGYGFLTSNPSFAGPALQLECGLHLPALNASRRIHAVQQALAVMGFELQPLSLRTPGTAEAGFFRIVSRGGMKFSEEVLYHRFKRQIDTVLSAEKEAMEKWTEREKNQLQDRLHHSLQSLQKAETLDYSAFLNLVSLVRVGAYSGLFPLGLLEPLEELRVQTLPFHLLASSPKNQDFDIDILRAHTVKTRLQNTGLTV